MDIKEIIALVDDARMRYEEALISRLHIDEEKRRYTNILITHASDLIKAAGCYADMAATQERAKVPKKGASKDGIGQA